MSKQKSIQSIIKTPGTIRGVLKRKKIYELPDPEGNEISLDYIKDHLLVKDNFVRDIATLWIDLWLKIRHLKALLLKGGPEMYELLHENGDIRSDSKGGFTEYDFSKNIRVRVSYDLRYDWDHDLMDQASKHFDAWLKKQGETSISRAFRKAFRKQDGQYDIKALNRLNQLEEKDTDFLRAMALKNEAQSSTPTKLRTTLEVRDAMGEFKALPLNISAVMPGNTNEFSIDDQTDEEFFETLLNPKP